MHSLAVAALLLAGAVSAAPPPLHGGASARSSQTISVTTPRRALGAKAGPKALAKAFMKYGKPVPDWLQAAISSPDEAKRATGTAVNTPEQYDSEYLTPVGIGTPAQSLPLDFDTGSSDLWVFSSQTPKKDVDGQAIYSPGSSSSAKLLSGYSWEIEYGDGSSSSGDVYTDVVNIGGLSVTGQAVESAEKVSSEFTEDSGNSGLVGLAFDSLNTVEPNQQKTWLTNVLPQLSAPVFTADLKHNANGHYNFGYIDSTVPTSSITYVSISTANGFWEWESTGYAIGTGSFTSSSIDGIADTGTTLLLLPSNVVSAYYKQVKGSQNSNSEGGYIFPCSATLPTFTFGVGSSRITVPSTYLNYSPASGSTCYGGIQSNTGIGFSIFGDVALKSAFVVFNRTSTPALGWATKVLD